MKGCLELSLVDIVDVVGGVEIGVLCCSSCVVVQVSLVLRCPRGSRRSSCSSRSGNSTEVVPDQGLVDVVDAAMLNCGSNIDLSFPMKSLE